MVSRENNGFILMEKELVKFYSDYTKGFLIFRLVLKKKCTNLYIFVKNKQKKG